MARSQRRLPAAMPAAPPPPAGAPIIAEKPMGRQELHPQHASEQNYDPAPTAKHNLSGDNVI